jgi:large subunit ribosomal protein L6
MKISLKEIKVFFYKNHLFFTSQIGIVKLNVTNLLSIVKFSICKDFIDINAYKKDSNSDEITSNCYDNIKKIVSRILVTYKKKLLLFGIGFRCWVFKNNNIEHLILKIGFSRDLCIKVPLMIKIIALKPTLILFKGFDKVKLNQFVSLIRSLRIPDSYKGKGIQYIGEKLVLKAGKHN